MEGPKGEDLGFSVAFRAFSTAPDQRLVGSGSCIWVMLSALQMSTAMTGGDSP